AYEVVRDADNNAYVTGTFTGSADFDRDRSYGDNRDLLSTTSAGAAFLAKYDPDGLVLWVRKLQPAGAADTAAGFDVALDGGGHTNTADDVLYVTGSFGGTASYAGNAAVTSAGGSDVFVLKVDSGGSQVWLRRLGGTGADAGQGTALAPSGDVLVTGSFSATTD